MTTIHRRDPARRMARFYALAVQADLLCGGSGAGSDGLVACGWIRIRSCRSPRWLARNSRPASGAEGMADDLPLGIFPPLDAHPLEEREGPCLGLWIGFR